MAAIRVIAAAVAILGAVLGLTLLVWTSSQLTVGLSEQAPWFLTIVAAVWFASVVFSAWPLLSRKNSNA